ncbi:MAG: hypothetical protein WAM82_03605 [Thermoanaerobaculia bacterium]
MKRLIEVLAPGSTQRLVLFAQVFDQPDPESGISQRAIDPARGFQIRR